MIDVPSGSVYVRTWTPAATTHETPVVLVHDSLGRVDLWRTFPELLARRLGRAVIAYDRLGHGRSTPLMERPTFGFVRVEAEERFPALCEGLGLSECVLLGHSVGGAIALAAAGAEPGRCRAVVCESAMVMIEGRTLAGIRRAKEQFKDPRHFERLARWHGDKARWVLDAWTELWLASPPPGQRPWSIAPVLPRVRCPALALHGDEDEYGSVRFPELIRDGVAGPFEMRILERCGHVPHREHPEAVAEHVRRFLGRHAAPRPAEQAG